MKISAQNLTNIQLSLIIKSKKLSNKEISELIGINANSETEDNKQSLWQFDEKNVSRTYPYSEDFEIDMFIFDNLQQKQKIWDTLKEKAETTLLIKANDNFEHRSVDEDVKFNSEIEISAKTMAKLVKRNINLKIDQSFLLKFYDYTF